MNFRQPNEDLFETSRMSFGQHLEELRKVLIRALIGVAIGCSLGFLIADRVVKVLEQPLKEAVTEYDLHEASQELVERYEFVPPEYLARMEQDQLLPKVYLVDPGQFVKSLRSVIPGFGDQVNLQSYSFRASHFDQTALPRLAQQLSTQTGDSTNAKKRSSAWSLLTTEDQAVVTEIAATPKATDEQLAKLVAVFNRLAEQRELSDALPFQDELHESGGGFWAMFDPPKPKPLARLKTRLDAEFDSSLNRRLNRALITRMFSEDMPPLKIDLVPIEVWEESEFKPQALGVAEPFSVWLKAGLFTGLIISGPWVFYQLWSFVAAGLYPHEQKYIHIFLPISIGLFVSGVLLAFFFVFQPVLGFLFSFNRSMGIAPEMRINDWLSFVMFLPLGFGLAFQLPLVMLFMNRIGLFSVSDYMSKWRIAVLVIFVLAMFLTPADPISMLLLAIPLTLLYFLGVAMCRWMPSSQNPFGEDGATETA